MKTCWDVLGIKPTTDIKVIKSTYAKQLKNNRPDEKPTEFQQLNNAYKYALADAKQVNDQKHSSALNSHSELSNSELSNNEQETYIGDDNQHDDVNNNNSENSTQKLTTEEIEYNQKCENEYAHLVNCFIELLGDKFKRNKTSEWHFLLASQFILLPDFNTQLGLYILNSIDQHNLTIKSPAARKRSGRQRSHSEPNAQVNIYIIKYLNTIFNWSGQAQMVEHHLGKEVCKRMLSTVELRQSHTEQQQNVINSVKGGSIDLKNNNYKTKQEYDFIVEAYNNVIKLYGLITFINLIVPLFYFKDFILDKNMLVIGIIVLFDILLILQWYGIKKRKIFAYYSMWIFSSLLLFAFPLGTIYGVITMINLYKSRDIHTLKLIPK